MAPISSNRLKTITIVAAFLQILVFVILSTSGIFFSYKPANHVISILSACVVMVYYVVNIVLTGYFIYKAFLNEPKCITYELVLLSNVVILIVHIEFDYAVLALLEFYIFCCTFLLRRRYLKSLLTDPETPPPTYNSCNNDAQMPLAGPSSESEAQVNSEANAEVVSDTQVDPPKNTNETPESSGSVK